MRGPLAQTHVGADRVIWNNKYVNTPATTPCAPRDLWPQPTVAQITFTFIQLPGPPSRVCFFKKGGKIHTEKMVTHFLTKFCTFQIGQPFKKNVGTERMWFFQLQDCITLERSQLKKKMRYSLIRSTSSCKYVLFQKNIRSYMISEIYTYAAMLWWNLI